MANSLKLAFVGCGAVASYHLNGIRECGDKIMVTAAIDIDRTKAERIAAETGAQIFPSLTEAIPKGDFDAVDIMLPHDLHESAAIQAFQAGKHVLLEKPMAPTLDACNRILSAAKAAGTVFMVAENAQYWPEIVKAREFIEAGVIGEIITARTAFAVEFDKYWFKDKQPWRYERTRTGGGIAIDGGSHWIRPLRIWMGEIDEVIAVVGYPLKQMEGESLVRAIFRFESGKVASFDAIMADTVLAPEPWWRITGTIGEILIEGSIKGGLSGGIKLFDPANRQGKAVAEPQGYAKSFEPELNDFANAVLYGKPLEAGPEYALGELRTILAMYRSVESKRWEKVSAH
jgi:predicted dehydrogenase